MMSGSGGRQPQIQGEQSDADRDAPLDAPLRTAPPSGVRSLPSPEYLPFTVRVVRSEEQLRKAVLVRSAAYTRHVPEFGRLLSRPEHYDREPGALVLLCESKLDGAPVGSLRIQTNHHESLALENSILLPNRFRDCSLAEITRLSVAEGRESRLVTTVLVKASYLLSVALQVEWIVICARRPLDRRYLDLKFEDIFPDAQFVPMPHIGDLPHRILGFEVRTAERRWHESQHHLYDFMARTYHPDIQVLSSLSGAWVNPRLGLRDTVEPLG